MTDWTSYKDAAKAGYSNIATQGEWERRKKMGYSTYQDYLKAMHEKHASGSNNTTLTAPAPTTVPTTPGTASKGTTPSGGSNDFGAKYSGKDYLQWYKTNYGSDYVPESGSPNFAELDDVDGAIGQSLFNYYQLKQNAEKNHNSQVENINKGYDSTIDTIKNQYDSQTQLLLDMYGNANEVLDKSKSNSQQSASITLDKLKKYLPTQIKAQGLGGLGVSESTMLQSHNNYNNQMGQIESNYNTQKSAIDKNYNENKASYDNTYNNSTADIKSEKERALAELLNNYSEKTAEYDIGAGSDSARIFDAYKTNEENKKEQLRQEELAKKEDEKNLVYNELMGRIEMGAGYGYNTTHELEKSYEEIKDSLTTAQQKLIEGRISQLKNSANSQQNDSDYYKNAFYKDGGAMGQEAAESAIQLINSDNDIESNEKERYQKAFETLYPNSYYTSTNKSKVDTKSRYDLYSALGDTSIGKDDLNKVNINTIQTDSPFGKWQMYWKGRDGWYCYSSGGTEYWYKKK